MPAQTPMARPVRLGFLGAGEFATSMMAPVVRRCDGVELTAVASRDPERAAALQPGRTYGDYDALLGDPDVDVVYVCLSNDQHVPWTLAALDAGKHVLCEKPLALTPADARRVFAAAEDADRLALEGFWYRWHPRQRELERLVRSGVVGRVEGVDVGFVFDRDLTGNFRLEPALGGGAAYDVGCYAVSAAVALLDDAAPTSVTGVRLSGASGTLLDGVAAEVDLRAEAVLGWPGGVQARVVGGMSGPTAQWCTVRGTEAIVTVLPPVFSGAPEPSGGTVLEVLRADGEVDAVVVPPADPRRAMVEDVAAAVRAWDSGTRVALPVTPEHTLAVAEGLALVLGGSRIMAA